MDEKTKQLFEKAKEFVRTTIKSTDYPIGHPFTANEFNDQDIVFLILSYLHVSGIPETILKDYISDKLVAVNNGIFSSERYFQGLSEITLLHYMLLGLQTNDKINIRSFIYEPTSPYNKEKKLEYSLFTTNDIYINIEIKTITCDPIIKEDIFKIVDNQKFIKKFFNDVHLEELVDKALLDDYTILDQSTHYRQLNKNLKKILEKFDGNEPPTNKNYNIGIVVIQFATSMEEFYSYMFNPDRGLIHKLNFTNLDSIVFFSLTPKCGLDMQDIFDREHIFTIMLNNSSEAKKLMEALRFNHFATDCYTVLSPYKEESEKVFGTYKSVFRDGLFFMCDEHTTEESIQSYIDYLKDKRIVLK